MAGADLDKQPDSVSSVLKVFGILQALGEEREIGITELSQRVMMSKSTVYRFLQTMKTLGYVAQEGESEKYSLTLKLFELGARALQNVDLIRSADIQMREISRLTKETIHLGALDEDSIVYIHKIDSMYNLRMYSRIGRRNPLYSTAIGKVLLAWRDRDEVKQILEGVEYKRSTERTIISTEALLPVLDQVREQGYGEDNEYKNEKPETGKIIAEDNYYVNQDKNNYYLSVLYGKLFADDWHLRVGYIGRFKDESYHAYGNKLAAGEWQSDPQKENEYNFNRRTNLLLAALEKKWGGFCAEAGVQGELNWQKIDTRYQTDDVLEKIPMVKSTSRFHLFPRLKLGYRTDKAGELALSYVQRVIRPYGSYLNVFTDRSDATHVWKGNPDLKDEMIHSVELSYSYATSAFRFSPSLYYRNKKNRIMDKVLDEGENGTIWTKENIGHSQTFGFELSGTWQPIRMLSLGLSGDIYRDEIDGRTIGYDRKKSMVCGDIKGSVNISITPTTELQLDGFYISDQLTPQGKIKHRSSVNAGISQYFMHRKLRANLSINNIFNGLEETTIVDTKDLQMTQVRNRDAQVTWVTLTYNL